MQNKPNMRKLVFQFLTILLFVSCVSNKEFAKLQNELKQNEKAQASLAVKLTELIKENTNNKQELAVLKRAYKRWANDSITISESLTEANEALDALRKSNQTLKGNYEELLNHSGSRHQKLIRQLGEKEQLLKQQELAVNDQKNKLIDLEKTLSQREARVQELEAIIQKQEESVGQLKEKITSALIGFDDSELSVEVKDGKVYVSLSNKLLFKSGSISVDPKGVEALKKLGVALSQNNDVNILIEGHTDADQFAAKSSMKDNWDLSVLRATSIVRILSKEVAPERITCAGRGEYVPVASNETVEGKSKNRRTEIILTPDLSALFEILDAN